MAQSNYQEPIEKEDLDLKKKFSTGGESAVAAVSEKMTEKGEAMPSSEMPSPEKTEAEPVGAERESGAEVVEAKVSEKIETARKTITTQTPAAQTTVHDDAKTIGQIAEYEKKVEKLVEMALQKGPEHAISVAQHIDANDNYTMDELHDRMIADDLRKQLIQKGLLKEI